MILSWLLKVIRWVGWILLSPFRFVLMVRRATTEASVSLLLIVIVSVNIVWGYPWTGMFAASLTMLVGGFIASTVFRPRAELDASLPPHAVAGQPFAAEVHVNHHGVFPAFDVTLDRVVSRFPSKTPVKVCGPGFPLAALTPNEWAQSRLMMVCQQRGVHALPNLQLRSTFPFCLFQSEQRVQIDSQIVVTPQPFTEEGDLGSKQFYDQIDRWAQSSLGGDSFDYAGSREYIVGMPVRRWDFRSWARLGRPIVREFQSPSRQVANLVVDTGVSDAMDPVEASELFELMLRYVATAVEICNRDGVAAQLYVASETVEDLIHRIEQDSSLNTMSLFPLAIASITDRETVNPRIQRALNEILVGPALLFTTRDFSETPGLELSSRATVVHVTSSLDRSRSSNTDRAGMVRWSELSNDSLVSTVESSS